MMGASTSSASLCPSWTAFNFPATFFIITGEIPGSRYQGTFIGRPKNRSFKRRLTYRPNSGNFFERASAVGFLAYEGTQSTHQAGETYDEGNTAESAAKAYKIIDEAYAKVRQSAFKPKTSRDHGKFGQVTWPELPAWLTDTTNSPATLFPPPLGSA